MGFLNQWQVLSWLKETWEVKSGFADGETNMQSSKRHCNSNCKRLWKSNVLVEADLNDLFTIWNRTAMVKLLKSPRILSIRTMLSPKEHPFSFPDIEQCCTPTEGKLSMLVLRKLTLSFIICLWKAIVQWLAKYLSDSSWCLIKGLRKHWQI